MQLSWAGRGQFWVELGLTQVAGHPVPWGSKWLLAGQGISRGKITLLLISRTFYFNKRIFLKVFSLNDRHTTEALSPPAW